MSCWRSAWTRAGGHTEEPLESGERLAHRGDGHPHRSEVADFSAQEVGPLTPL